MGPKLTSAKSQMRVHLIFGEEISEGSRPHWWLNVCTKIVMWKKTMLSRYCVLVSFTGALLLSSAVCLTHSHRDRGFMAYSGALRKLLNLHHFVWQSAWAPTGTSWCIKVHLINSVIYSNGHEGCLNGKVSIFSYFPLLKYIVHNTCLSLLSCSFTVFLIIRC